MSNTTGFDFNKWAADFLSKAKEPCDGRAFLQLVFLEKEWTQCPSELQTFIYKVIDKRSKSIGLDLSISVKIWFSMIVKTPGEAVMYLYALRSKTEKCDMSTLAKVFPEGFLSDADLSLMWDAQKGSASAVACDNCLDHFNFTTHQIII